MNKSYENWIFKTLNKLDETYAKYPKKYKFFLIYYYSLEIIVKKYLDKLIFKSLLTEENIVDFFDRNEFGISNNEIYKMDLIDEFSHYGELKNLEAEKTIKREFQETLLEEIDKSNITIDIENYINVLVKIKNDTDKSVRIYSIYIRFYRNQIILENKSKYFRHIFFIVLLIGLVTFLGINYNKFI